MINAHDFLLLARGGDKERGGAHSRPPALIVSELFDGGFSRSTLGPGARATRRGAGRARLSAGGAAGGWQTRCGSCIEGRKPASMGPRLCAVRAPLLPPRCRPPSCAAVLLRRSGAPAAG